MCLHVVETDSPPLAARHVNDHNEGVSVCRCHHHRRQGSVTGKGQSYPDGRVDLRDDFVE